MVIKSMKIQVKSNVYKNIGYSVLLVLFMIWFSQIALDQYAKYTYEDITVSRVDKTSIFRIPFRFGKAVRSYYTFSIDSIGNVGAIEVYGNDGVILLAIDKKSKDIYLIKQLDDALLTQVGDTPSRVHTNGNAIKSQFKQHKLYWRETETMECYILSKQTQAIVDFFLEENKKELCDDKQIVITGGYIENDSTCLSHVYHLFKLIANFLHKRVQCIMEKPWMELIL